MATSTFESEKESAWFIYYDPIMFGSLRLCPRLSLPFNQQEGAMLDFTIVYHQWLDGKVVPLTVGEIIFAFPQDHTEVVLVHYRFAISELRKKAYMGEEYLRSLRFDIVFGLVMLLKNFGFETLRRTPSDQMIQSVNLLDDPSNFPL